MEPAEEEPARGPEPVAGRARPGEAPQRVELEYEGRDDGCAVRKARITMDRAGQDDGWSVRHRKDAVIGGHEQCPAVQAW